MLIIIDKKMPDEAKSKLRQDGDLLELYTSGITYSAISGHPDVFFCPTPKALCVAPNLPAIYFLYLSKHQVPYIIGESHVGKVYPETSQYNAVINNKYLIHNLKYTDIKLLQASDDLITIDVKQGYTRCSLLSFNADLNFTSDYGIFNTLSERGINCYFFSPQQIKLQGFAHGFLGGACGIWNRNIYICGSLKNHSWGMLFRNITEMAGYNIIELINDPLQDFGSILFINC